MLCIFYTELYTFRDSGVAYFGRLNNPLGRIRAKNNIRNYFPNDDSDFSTKYVAIYMVVFHI